MRILKIFFGFTVAILVVGLVIGLIWREILLYTAVGRVRSLARELNTTQPSLEFSQTCLEFGGVPVTDQSLTRTQLRFISPEKFILEIVCQTNESLRQTVKEESLPMLVTKENGQSGLISQQSGYGLTLTVLGRVGVVYQGDNFFQSATNYRGEPPLIFDQGPTTVCRGYGFTCCNPAFQAGQNQQETEAWDCPRSCYASCIDKPVILNFHSIPTFATTERIIELETNQAVEFFYTVNDLDGDSAARSSINEEDQSILNWPTRFLQMIGRLFGRSSSTKNLVEVVISFGDGQAAQVSNLQGSTTHTYTCGKPLCIYQAVIQATMENGTASTLDQQSSIQVEVRKP